MPARDPAVESGPKPTMNATTLYTVMHIKAAIGWVRKGI